MDLCADLPRGLYALVGAWALRGEGGSAVSVDGGGKGASDEASTAESESEVNRWARRAKGGDPGAIEWLVREFTPVVSRILWKFARTRPELEDLVQDTFLRMLRGLEKWRPEQPFRFWLLRVALNVGRDYFRREKVRTRWIATGQEEEDWADFSEEKPATVEGEALATVKRLLATLTPDARAIMTLHYLEGWSLERIGAQMGWTTTATKLRAWRARQQLKRVWSQEDLL